MVGIDSLEYRDVAKTIDHSLLRPELDLDTVRAGVELALRYDVASATVRPADVAWAAEAVPTLRLEVTDDPRAAVEGAGTVITGLSIGLRGQELDPVWVREDALLLPLDYASSVGSRLAREATLVSDDVEQLAAVAPAKLAADYPPATGWTGDAIRQPRPAGRLVSQNLGIAATDVVLATYVADRAADRGAGTVLAR